jgi:transposase
VKPERVTVVASDVVSSGLRRLRHPKYLSAQYHRLAAKRNKNRAIIAVAHSILIIVYFMIKTGEEYRESSGDYFQRINAEGLKHYFVKRLERLGHKVMLEAIPNMA